MIISENRTVSVETDGDLTLTHLREVLDAGAGIAVVGKALFEGSLADNIRSYQRAAEGVK